MAKKSDAFADEREVEDRQMTLPFPPQVVRKSNALCRARYGPESVFEPRIVAAIATRVKPGDDDALVYEIPVVDLLGTGYGGDHLDRLEAAAEKLVSRVVKLKSEKGWSVMSMVSECTYEKATGYLTCRIAEKIRPHFLWYNQNILQYARYDYLEFLKLPSMYSQRIFEFLKSWQSEPGCTESLDNLHEMLCTPKTYRANFTDFDRAVLTPARKHIHKNTAMRFAYTPLKRGGKKVVEIRFTFSKRAVGEQQLEDARKAQGKAAANAGQRARAWREAAHCAEEKKGVCTMLDRAKRVCDICREGLLIEDVAEKNGVTPVRSKTETSQ